MNTLRALLALCLSVAAFGQSAGVGQLWTVVSGTLQSGATASGNGTALSVRGLATAILTVNCSSCSGGTIVNFEVSEDGTNFTGIQAFLQGTSTVATSTTTSGIGVWAVPIAGFQSIRARISAYSAGTVTVTGTAVAVPYGPAAGPVGQAAMAASIPVTIASDQSNVPDNVKQLNGTTVDTNSGSKSAGTMRVVLATDQPALTNKLLVTPDSVALPANQSVNAAQVGGTATDTNSGTKSAGTLRVVLATDQPALTNKLLVTPDSVALPANQSVNTAQINGVTPLMGNGGTGTGSPRVTIASDNTAFTVNAAQSGNWTARIQGNAGAAIDAATGAAPPANGVLMAGLTSGATGGFMTGIPVADTFFNVNIATATTTLAVTGVSGRHVRITGLSLVTLAANNVAFISGTGATCGTGSAAIVGTTSATGFNLAANGGIAHGGGLGAIMRTVATGDSVCIITSAATQLSGVISYTIY